MENKSLKFSEYKEQIIKALNEKKADLGIQEPVTLIDGFINQPIHNELTGAFVIGGPTIPIIAVIGNKSGRLYFFALKAILPDLKI